jgi:hypothetical protein
LEFDVYRDEDELCLFISFLRMATRIVLYTYKTEEKVEDSGSLRQWEEELCPYDFPTKEEKENAVAKEEKKEPHSYEGIYLSKKREGCLNFYKLTKTSSLLPIVTTENHLNIIQYLVGCLEYIYIFWNYTSQYLAI